MFNNSAAQKDLSMSYRVILGLCLLFLMSGLVSIGQTQSIPNAVPCLGRTANGMSAQVIQNTGPVNAWAMTMWPNGIPMTTYGPMYFKLPPLIQRFTSLHECGHASTGDPNEFHANCFALQHGGFSQEQIQQIGRFYTNWLGSIPPQYGGTGTAFWAGTMAACPAIFTSLVPSPVPNPVDHSSPKSILNQLANAASGNFHSLHGTPSDPIDGEKTWDTHVRFGSNNPCVVYGGKADENLNPRVSCDLEQGLTGEESPSETYDDASQLVKSVFGSTADYHEETAKDGTKTFYAGLPGYWVEVEAMPSGKGVDVDLTVEVKPHD